MTHNPYDWAAHMAQHLATPAPATSMPVIGITGNFGDKGCELAKGYYQSVLRAGGLPLVIPPFEDMDALEAMLGRVDALLLSGGGDLNPLLMGQEPIPQLGSICHERDKAELCLMRMAYHRQMPVLGICRGIQVMAAALGGNVFQDIASQFQGSTPPIKHNQQMGREYASHTVHISADSLLNQIMGTQQMVVNSFHHQAVAQPGPALRVCATSADGVIEAVESTEHKSLLGVQWHPECFVLGGDDSMKPLFEWLVGEAREYAQARQIHSRILSLDSHCDTPMCFAQAQKAGLTPAQLWSNRTDLAQIDLHKMQEGMLDACIMVAYLPQGARNEASHLQASHTARRLLGQIEQMIGTHPHAADLASTPAQVRALKAEGKRAVMMGVENGYAIGRNIRLVEEFRRQGVVYLTLCHNGDNDICDSAVGQGEHGGVSKFGAEVIREMNRVGMMLDLSHASEKSFYDALHLSQTPIVCSHSSAYALCQHPRNLTDEQMRQLAQRGGVAQVTTYSGFLCQQGQASILHLVDHLRHMARVMGVEHVGIGTDWDGGGGIPGMASASEAINFTRHLLRHHFSEEDIRLIWGGNFLRVMEQVQQFHFKLT